MAGNTLDNLSATGDEIASALSSELQRAFVQLIALRIENAKLRQRINELTDNSVSNSVKF